MDPADPLASVAFAISSFRDDASVIRLLETAFAGGRAQFGTVIVVESLGSGVVPARIAAEGWPVTYIDADYNLGSAGNLALRLETAAQAGADWCYTANADGRVDTDQVRALVRHGASRPRVGAVYPVLLYSARGALEAPKRTLAPRAKFDFDWKAASATCQEVAWSSSNCALYALAPVREGCKVWADLWLGWEDLAFGWTLGKHGWVQLQCGDVVVVDDYEYKAVKAAGRNVHIVTKPAWYAYYQIRNMILVNRRSGGEACSWYQIARRILVSSAIALLFGKDRMKWARLFGSGIRDGLRGKAGHGGVP